ncbi:flagellar protein FlaB [Acidithiobacillus ferrivorans]|nr:flagellar protein FlaB [Acidithiobacillus ferrivorans]
MSTAFGSINTNVGSLYALNSLGNTNQNINSLQQQLATGLSINSPASNPAGYTIAQGFTTQINGSNQGISNANQGITMLETATGAIGQQTNILQNMRTIAVQSANGTNTTADLNSMQSTIAQLTAQVSTIAQQTQFNGINLLDGSFAGAQFQVGANQGQVITASVGNMSSTNLGMYQTSASGTVYGSGGSTVPYDFAVSSGGAFTSGNLTVFGSQGSGTVTVTSTGESAASIAASTNQVASETGVNAQAYTSVNMAVTGGTISFRLGNGTASGQTNAVTINANVTGSSASGLSSLVQAINNNNATTGISASVNTNNQLVLTDVAGNNISITQFSGTGSLAASGGGNNFVFSSGSTGNTSGTIQGIVNFQAPGAFTVSGANNIGLASGSALTSLNSVNVTTQYGANQAISIMSYAIQQLNNQNTQLGAVQQRVASALSNQQTTSVNDQAAQSVIQDANIPQVSTQLTQAQILQQAGVGALMSSTQTQQAYLKLIP